MSSRNDEVKIGVVGCGWVARQRHLPVLRTLPEAEVVAVADTDARRLAETADEFRIENRYADYRSLLNDSQIELVAICLPAQFHMQAALDAIDAGKHLLIEKPLALSVEECNQLIERAARSQMKIAVGFNLRWHRLIRQAREIVDSGSLGRINFVRALFTNGAGQDVHAPEWKRRRETGGGVLFELAVHHFDLWRFLLRQEVAELFAFSRAEDETATLTAQLTGGVLTEASFSANTGEHNEIEIYGERGRLRVSCYRFDGLEFSLNDGVPTTMQNRLRQAGRLAWEVPQAWWRGRQGGDHMLSYREQWRDMIQCVRGDTSIGCTLEDGKQATAIALAAIASITRGEQIKLTSDS